MQESYGKGLATHAGHESCLDDPQGRGEALTVERTGGPLSSEITFPGCGPCGVRGNATSGAASKASGTGIRRSQRTWHVRKLHARKSGDPDCSPRQRQLVTEEHW